MPPPLDPPADIPPLFAGERAALLGLLSGLAQGDWVRPTPCPEWTVLGLACHLLGDDLGFLARHRDRYFGTPPPEGATEAEFIGWLDELQAEWVRAARRVSPRLVVDLLTWTGPQVVETLRSEDPRAPTAHVSWAGPEPAPVWLDHIRELSEHWIHRQQLLQALGREPDLDPAVVRPVLLGLRWAYPFRLRSPAVSCRDGDTVRIDVTGPVTETWFVVASGTGDWDFRVESGVRTVATMSLTTDRLWRLLTNNLTRDQEDRIAFDGDGHIVSVLRDTRAIIGEPKAGT